MSGEVRAALTGVVILATAVWVGGFVTIFVVARVATRTLSPLDRVAFFRTLGRVHGIVGSCALVVALGCGVALVAGRPWDGTLIAAVVVAAALLAAAVTGMAQARHMTRLRRTALQAQGQTELPDRVRRGARTAGMLRALIGVLSLALLALGVALGS